MVSLPAQGHLNQLLHLSRLISTYNIPVHFVGTTTHNRQAKTRVQGWDPIAVTNIKFHEFPTPPFSNPLPDPNSCIKFPSQLFLSIHALTKLREPIYTLVLELSRTMRRVVVIYDSLMAYVVQDLDSIPNVESYCFQSISALSLYSFYWEAARKPALPAAADNIKEVSSVEGCFSPEFLELSKLQSEVKIFNSGEIYNTARVVEGLYLDLIAKDQSTGTEKLWALGPFNPVPVPGKNHANNSRNKCLEWLDKQDTNSVIFVSFGSTSSLSDEQTTELALGLERSEQKFIWVLRDADKGDICKGDVRKTPLPEMYKERISGTGLVVRDWAPQLEILGTMLSGTFLRIKSSLKELTFNGGFQILWVRR